jgi:hypothetical protein
LDGVHDVDEVDDVAEVAEVAEEVSCLRKPVSYVRKEELVKSTRKSGGGLDGESKGD